MVSQFSHWLKRTRVGESAHKMVFISGKIHPLWLLRVFLRLRSTSLCSSGCSWTCALPASVSQVYTTPTSLIQSSTFLTFSQKWTCLTLRSPLTAEPARASLHLFVKPANSLLITWKFYSEHQKQLVWILPQDRAAVLNLWVSTPGANLYLQKYLYDDSW